MHFKMLSAICFNLDQSKILSSGNGLTQSLSNDNICKCMSDSSKLKAIPDDKLFNPFPDNKYLTLPKLKAFADDKINVTYMIDNF